MSDQNKAIVRRLFEDHWNSKNAALLSELFAPTVSLHTPDGVLTGLDGASSLLQAYATAFPDFHLAIDEVVAIDHVGREENWQGGRGEQREVAKLSDIALVEQPDLPGR